MPIPAVDAVVFDIDDTLYLERDYVRSGFGAVDRWCQEHLDRSSFFTQAWQLFGCGARGDIFNRVLEGWGLPADSSVVGQMVMVYREHKPEIALLLDAADCVARLHGRVKLAAISDGPLVSQQAKVRRLGVDRTFDRILLTASLGAEFAKPHPRAFVETQGFLKCDCRRCVYIADNPAKDFQTPHRLNWRTIRVRRQEGLHADRPGIVPVDFTVDDLSQVPELLGVWP